MNIPVNSTDPTHSLVMVSQAAVLMATAHTMIAEAYRLVKDDWQWHHPESDFKLPDDIQTDAMKCLESTQHFKASVHWTMNTLRGEAV